jgi:alpha-glucosidase
MQWDGAPNAGFSQKTPWLPVPPSYATHNVANESKDPDSVLSVYKKVLALRHTNAALLDGSYTALNEEDVNVLSYLRSYKGKAVLVVLNMSDAPRTVKFDLARQGFPTFMLTPLVGSAEVGRNGAVALEPFGAVVAEVNK